MPRQGGRHEYAVIGLGRFGTSLAMYLVERGHYVLGIDRNRGIVQRLSDELTRCVALDATDDDALRAIDIVSFEAAVVAIGTDFESNLLITSSLKSMGMKRVVCKAINERQRMILERIGADHVVLPEHEAGRRLARTLIEPGVLDQLELGPGYSVTEMLVPPMLIGKTLVDADLRRGFNITVLAVRRGDEIIVSPDTRYSFGPGDHLVVFGTNASIHRFHDLL